MSVVWRECHVCGETTVQRHKLADNFGIQYRYWCHREHWADPDAAADSAPRGA